MPTPEEERNKVTGFPSAEDRFLELSLSSTGAQSTFEKRQAWYYLINGYKQAADLLVTHRDEGDSRKLLFPIAFLYRHHLELALKALILACRRVLGWEEAFPADHSLDKLWKLCVDFLKELAPATLENDEIEQTLRLIAEFNRIDPTSEAFRYAEPKRQAPRTTNVEIDLAAMQTVVGKISLLIECIEASITHERDDAF